MLDIIIDKEAIQNLLSNIKRSIITDGVLVVSNRSKNNNFCYRYGLSSKIIKQIICNLNYKDFVEVLNNEHIGYEKEYLFLFAPTVRLTNIKGKTDKMQLYLKINYIKEKKVVILVSFHKANYKLKYYFKEGIV